MWSSRAYPQICGIIHHGNNQLCLGLTCQNINSVLAVKFATKSCCNCNSLLPSLTALSHTFPGDEFTSLAMPANILICAACEWFLQHACLLLQVENYEIELRFPRGDESTWNVEWILQRLETKVSFTFHREDFPRRLKVMCGFGFANFINWTVKKFFSFKFLNWHFPAKFFYFLVTQIFSLP